MSAEYWGRIRKGGDGQSQRGALLILIGLAATLLLTLMPAGASGATCTDAWTGASEAAWGIASNWSAKRVPTKTDVACIPASKVATVASGSFQVGTVQGEGKLELAGPGTLEVVSTSTPSTIKYLVMAGGTLSGSARVSVSGNLYWKSESTMKGTGSTFVLPGATATVNNSESFGSIRIESRPFTNEGTYTASNGIILLSNGAQFTNTGVFEANAEAFSIFETYNWR